MKKYLKILLVMVGLMAAPVVSAQASSYNATKTLYHTKYNFYKEPYNSGDKKIKSAKNLYGHKYKVTQSVKNDHGTFYKTTAGWINRDAFYKWVRNSANLDNAKGTIIKNADLYSAQWGLKGAKITGNTKGLVGRTYKIEKTSELNTYAHFYLINIDGQTHWIKGSAVRLSVAGLKSKSSTIEKAIAAGEKLVGKSSYNWGGGRTSYDVARKSFDCSSFVHYMYSKAGRKLGARYNVVTYSLVHKGRAVSYKNMKRGDILFFDDAQEGRNCHVAIYLGNHLFLHDSPSSDTGGVGISSLQDPHWGARFNHIVRRIVG